MTWNWQQTNWPIFTWDRARFEIAERQFLVGGGVLVGAVKHLGSEEQDQLAIEVMSSEALTTSEIEGEILDRASVQSSIRKQMGLEKDGHREGPAEPFKTHREIGVQEFGLAYGPYKPEGRSLNVFLIKHTPQVGSRPVLQSLRLNE